MKKPHNLHLKKTYALTTALSIIAIIIASIAQIFQTVYLRGYPYLNPFIIHLLAFFGGTFLIFEGIYRIHQHKRESMKRQLTRSIRIALGFAIITIHIVQITFK